MEWASPIFTFEVILDLKDQALDLVRQRLNQEPGKVQSNKTKSKRLKGLVIQEGEQLH